MGETLRVTVPGAAMIAVTFGLARYGYGLLLPRMQTGLGIDARTGGLIASAAYVSYLAGNAAVVWLTGRFGPRPPLLMATVAAASGMAMIAAAGGATGLAAGVLVAGAAAGLAFPPYADVVARTVEPRRRPVAWSAISSGTGWGVALAGAVAIVFGDRWRAAWLAFAALAVVAGVVAVRAAPARRGGSPPPFERSFTTPTPSKWLRNRRAGPLLTSAVLIGAGSSVWWVFSVDALRAAGLAATPASGVYALCGACGVLASVTGAITTRTGLRSCYLAACTALAVAVGLLGLVAGSVVAVLVAGTLFGIAYSVVIAVQGLWNADIFTERPSAGLAAVNTALTIGTIIGPSIAGVMIHSHGYAPAFAGAAVIIGLAALTSPPNQCTKLSQGTREAGRAG
jgi:predicted MFS family arabinose efflux permease